MSLPALAGLLSALAAMVVLLLYWLKPPPRQLAVSSMLIWDRVLRKSHAGSDRLRWWLSLLLSALIAAAMASALAHWPSVRPGAGGAQRLILILDNSATMATLRTDGVTRWDHALARADALLRERPAATAVMIADSMRRIAIPSFEERDAALARMQSLTTSFGDRPRVPELAPMADTETIVFTDGVRLTGVPQSAKVESVFEAVENSGIVAFEVRAVPGDPRRQLAYVEIANAGGTAKTIEVILTGLGGRQSEKSLQVPAGRTGHVQIDVSGFEAGPLKASLRMPGDALSVDDVAYAVRQASRVVRVGLVGAANAYLEKSLRARHQVRLQVLSLEAYADRDDIDVWIFDRFAPSRRPRAPALLFRPGNAAWLPPAGAEIVAPVPESWEAAHPLLANLVLRELVIDRAVVSNPTEFSLIRARRGMPLVIAQDSFPRQIWLAFGLGDSNFALHAGFPVFVDNALTWLTGENETLAARLGRAEVPFPDAKVQAADGSMLSTTAVPDGTAFEIGSPGLYSAVSGQRRALFTASLLDGDITGVNRTSLAAESAAASGKPFSTWEKTDPWILLLWAAAIALIFEWWSWNRRLTV
ncbi:MAG: BatA domain-containing protein [Burkholderiales bacterium]